MGPRRTSLLLLLIAGALAVPAVAQAADQAVSFPVGMPGAFMYDPSTVNILSGDTVTFNGSFMSHPLAWDNGTFGPTNTGSSRQFAFPTPGTFPFHCTIHATMVGKVVVANRVATPDFSFSPAQPQPGQSVTFTPGSFTDPDGSIAQYQWDLDGDGSFEATGTQVSRSYGSAGTVRVSLQYVDNLGETSPATAHDVVVRPGAAAGGGGGGSGSGGPGGGSPGSPGGGSSPTATPGEQGAGSAPTSTAPAVRVPSRALTFGHGVATLKLTAKRAGKVTVTLRRKKTLLARGSATAKKAGPFTVRLALTRAGRSRLAAGKPVTATLTVTQGKAERQTTLTLRRG